MRSNRSEDHSARTGSDSVCSERAAGETRGATIDVHSAAICVNTDNEIRTTYLTFIIHEAEFLAKVHRLNVELLVLPT